MENSDHQQDDTAMARRRIHALAGLLTGLFAAVDVAKTSESDVRVECLNNASSMIEQAQDELRELRDIVHRIA
jgi:hypothetical protein